MPTKLSRSHTPKHIAISNKLIRDINAGRLIKGEKLPPERQMARSHNVGIGTFRKALRILEDKKLLDRVQGSGNYVRHSIEAENTYALFRLELESGGGSPKAQIVDLTAMNKPRDLPVFGTSEEATRIRRLRYLDDQIVALEEIWLDGDAGKLPDRGITDSLYDFYNKHLNFWITRAEDSVGVSKIPKWVPPVFHKKAGEVAGFVQRLSWADSPQPIEYSRTWFDYELAKYTQRLM